MPDAITNPLVCPECGEPPTYMAPVVRSDARLLTCINDHDWRWTPAPPAPAPDDAAHGGESMQVLTEKLIAAAERGPGTVVGTLRMLLMETHERALAAAEAVVKAACEWYEAERSYLMFGTQMPDLWMQEREKLEALRAALRPARDDSTEVGRG